MYYQLCNKHNSFQQENITNECNTHPLSFISASLLSQWLKHLSQVLTLCGWIKAPWPFVPCSRLYLSALRRLPPPHCQLLDQLLLSSA